MGVALSIKNLTFSYDDKVKALKNISIDVEEGKYVSLIGHNGSGKSTLAQLLCNLITPTQGNIFLDGKDTNKDFKNKKEIDLSIL